MLYLNNHFEFLIGKHMFWNTVYLDEFIKASDGKKDDVPGHAYFRKLEQFIGHHYEVGDLYMEYTRGSCRKSLGKNIQLRQIAFLLHDFCNR